MTPLRASLIEVWKCLSWLDLVCSAVGAGGLLAVLFGLHGGFFSFLKYLAVLAGGILYSQLGAYLLHEDLQQRIAMIADISEHIAAAHATLPKGISEEESEGVLAAQSHSVHDRELPKLGIAFSNDANLLGKVAGPGAMSFAGIVQEGEQLSLMSIRAMPERDGLRLVTLRVPVTPEFLSGIAPDLGAIQLSLTE